MKTLRQRWLDQLIAWCNVEQKSHAWHTAKELEKNDLLTGIAKELEQAMRLLNAQQGKNGG